MSIIDGQHRIETLRRTHLPEIGKRDRIAELLELTAERIEKYGLVTYPHKLGGAFAIGKNKPRCVALHMSRVDGFSMYEVHAARRRLATHLGFPPSGKFTTARNLFNWNDRSDQTPQNVCRTLREAAASR